MPENQSTPPVERAVPLVERAVPLVERAERVEAKELDDTVVVPDETVVVADETIVVATPPTPRAERVETQEPEDVTRVVAKPRRKSVAPPVEEPEAPIPQDLAKLMFKPPLDPHRAVRESPFPQAEHTLPKTGVRQGMPVVYGAKSEFSDEYAAETMALDAKIGPPPAGGFIVPAQREGLPSMVRQNRKFRALALGGGAAVLLVVGFGLWGVGQLAFG